MKRRGKIETSNGNPPDSPVNPPHTTHRDALDALKKLFDCLRGQKRGRDKDQEQGLFQKATPIKLIHFPNNLENRVFSKK